MELEIRNYYEVLLLEQLKEDGLLDTASEDYLADLCCVALSRLPAKYIRYIVDTVFLKMQMSSNE